MTASFVAVSQFCSLATWEIPTRLIAVNRTTIAAATSCAAVIVMPPMENARTADPSADNAGKK